MGQERRIAVLALGLLKGEGLEPEDRYPARLEAVLRARGLNARVVAIPEGAGSAGLAVSLADPKRRPELVIVPPSLRDDPALNDPALNDPALSELLVRHGVVVIPADLHHTAKRRPELFQTDGHTLSALGIEELAVNMREAVMSALGTEPSALVAPN